jgi:hypothetical protein
VDRRYTVVVNRARLACCTVLLVACRDVAPPPTLDEVTEAVLASSVRDVDNALVPGVLADIGFQEARPDAAGLIRFPEQLPGRLTVWGWAEGFTRHVAVAQLETDHAAGARLWLAPTAAIPVDVAVGAEVPVGDATLSVGPGAWTAPDGTPFPGPVRLGLAVIGVADRAFPGQREWLEADQFARPFEPLLAFYLEAPLAADGRDAVWAPDATAHLHWTLPADFPYAGDRSLALYGFDTGRGYWVQLQMQTGTSGAIDVDFARFGWVAIGVGRTDEGCLAGQVVDAGGAPVLGAEVTAFEAGRLGVNRATTDVDGRFCVRGLSGSTLDLEVFGWSADGDVVVSGDASGTVGEDLGALSLTYGRDTDGDFFFVGEGDCDDADPANNPIDSGQVCLGG